MALPPRQFSIQSPRGNRRESGHPSSIHPSIRSVSTEVFCPQGLCTYCSHWLEDLSLQGSTRRTLFSFWSQFKYCLSFFLWGGGFFLLLLFVCFWPCPAAFEILVLQPGVELESTALESYLIYLISSNHRSPGKSLKCYLFKEIFPDSLIRAAPLLCPWLNGLLSPCFHLKSSVFALLHASVESSLLWKASITLPTRCLMPRTLLGTRAGERAGGRAGETRAER